MSSQILTKRLNNCILNINLMFYKNQNLNTMLNCFLPFLPMWLSCKPLIFKVTNISKNTGGNSSLTPFHSLYSTTLYSCSNYVNPSFSFSNLPFVCFMEDSMAINVSGDLVHYILTSLSTWFDTSVLNIVRVLSCLTTFYNWY